MSPEVLDTLKYGWGGDWTLLAAIVVAQITYLLGIGPLLDPDEVRARTLRALEEVAA